MGMMKHLQGRGDGGGVVAQNAQAVYEEALAKILVSECTECGVRLIEGVTICDLCEAGVEREDIPTPPEPELPVEPKKYWHCGKCGKRVKKGVETCDKCLEAAVDLAEQEKDYLAEIKQSASRALEDMIK